MKKHSSPQAKPNKKERGGPVIDDFVILADKNPNSSQPYCLQEKVFYLLNCIRQLLIIFINHIQGSTVDQDDV